MKKKIASILIAISAIFFTLILFQSCSPAEDTDNFEQFRTEGVAVQTEICAVKNDCEAIATIISDDGYYESGVIFNGLAKELNIYVTVAGAVTIIKPHLKDWQRIEREGHVDIVSHSYSHIKVCPEANLTHAQILHEYADAKAFYKQNFRTPSFTFVAPENITTDEGYSVLRDCGILAARLGSRGENPLTGINYGSAPGEWLNLNMRGLYDVSTTAQRNTWVDSAINNHAWLIEMWHDISEDDDLHFQPISTNDARDHLTYLSEKQSENKIWVASFTQAVSYIYQKDNGAISAYMLDDTIGVVFDRQQNNLPWNEFNVPLTVKVAIPSDWQSIIIKKGKSTVNFERKDDEVIFDLPTDGKALYIEKA